MSHYPPSRLKFVQQVAGRTYDLEEEPVYLPYDPSSCLEAVAEDGFSLHVKAQVDQLSVIDTHPRLTTLECLDFDAFFLYHEPTKNAFTTHLKLVTGDGRVVSNLASFKVGSLVLGGRQTSLSLAFFENVEEADLDEVRNLLLTCMNRVVSTLANSIPDPFLHWTLPNNTRSDPTKSLTSTSEVGKDLGMIFLKLLMSEVSRIGYSPALTLNITDTKGIWSSGTFEELEENARSLLGLPRAADFEDHGLTLLDLSVEYTAKPVVEGEEEDLLESLLATMQLEGEERPAPLPEDSFFNLEDAGSLVEDLCSLHPHAEEGSPLRLFVEGLVADYLSSFDRMKDWLHPREAVSLLFNAGTHGQVARNVLVGDPEAGVEPHEVLMAPVGSNSYCWNGLKKFSHFTTGHPRASFNPPEDREPLTFELHPCSGSVLAFKGYSTLFTSIKTERKLPPLISAYGKVRWAFDMGKKTQDELDTSFKAHARESLNFLLSLRKARAAPSTLRFEITVNGEDLADGVQLLRSYHEGFIEHRPFHAFSTASVGKFVQSSYEASLWALHRSIGPKEGVTEMDQLAAVCLFERLLNRMLLNGDLSQLPEALKDRYDQERILFSVLESDGDLLLPTYEEARELVRGTFQVGGRGVLAGLEPELYLSNVRLFNDLFEDPRYGDHFLGYLIILRTLKLYYEDVARTPQLKLWSHRDCSAWPKEPEEYVFHNLTQLFAANNNIVRGMGEVNTRKNRVIEFENGSYPRGFFSKGLTLSGCSYIRFFRTYRDRLHGLSDEWFERNLQFILSQNGLCIAKNTSHNNRFSHSMSVWEVFNREGEMNPSLRPFFENDAWTLDMVHRLHREVEEEERERMHEEEEEEEESEEEEEEEAKVDPPARRRGRHVAALASNYLKEETDESEAEEEEESTSDDEKEEEESEEEEDEGSEEGAEMVEEDDEEDEREPFIDPRVLERHGRRMAEAEMRRRTLILRYGNEARNEDPDLFYTGGRKYTRSKFRDQVRAILKEYA